MPEHPHHIRSEAYKYRFDLLFASLLCTIVVNIFFPEDIYDGIAQTIYLPIQLIAGITLFDIRRKGYLLTLLLFLGGLLIHGLFPGPDLFTEKADITYTFISGLLLAQFFMCFFGLLASRYSHLVANAPNYMMFAAVMILCVFGSYCVQNSYEDVILMFILGVLMFVLAKFGFPSAPIVLGIILGPIAEENFLRGKMIADTDVGVFSYFFTGGLNLALIALCLLSLIWGIYSEVKYMRNHSRKAAAAN